MSSLGVRDIIELLDQSGFVLHSQGQINGGSRFRAINNPNPVTHTPLLARHVSLHKRLDGTHPPSLAREFSTVHIT